ncbi:MAG TPA: acetate/propionate family kinase [Kiloniellales bacterium]
MSDAVLVLNAGSSSLKFALFETAAVACADPALRLRGQIESIGRTPRFDLESGAAPSPPDEKIAGIADHDGALAVLLEWLERAAGGTRLAAAGHRVVHGGPQNRGHARITPALLDELAGYAPLAPHHQPHNVAAIRAVAARRPGLAQVACFDTAFHAGQPQVAARLSLPRAYWDRGLRRYGFHGLSYEYVTGALPAVSGAPLPARVVIAHLGNGASLCAVRDGRGVATTMGFSTLDGLVMGTRCGALDPGALLYLMREEGLDEPALTDLLYNRSGLLGVSGLSADMRTLLASDAPAAAEAVELFCYRIVRELGSLAAALGGLDALVFTAGIGAHSAEVRRRVCAASAWLGIALDEAANERHGPRISTAGSAVSVLALPTDEELVIARHTLALAQG